MNKSVISVWFLFISFLQWISVTGTRWKHWSGMSFSHLVINHFLQHEINMCDTFESIWIRLVIFLSWPYRPELNKSNIIAVIITILITLTIFQCYHDPPLIFVSFLQAYSMSQSLDYKCCTNVWLWFSYSFVTFNQVVIIELDTAATFTWEIGTGVHNIKKFCLKAGPKKSNWIALCRKSD